MVQRSSQLWRDSSVVRALVGITRGPGFDPQLRCLNFLGLSVPVSVLSFFQLVCWYGSTDVSTQSGSAISNADSTFQTSAGKLYS